MSNASNFFQVWKSAIKRCKRRRKTAKTVRTFLPAETFATKKLNNPKLKNKLEANGGSNFFVGKSFASFLSLGFACAKVYLQVSGDLIEEVPNRSNCEMQNVSPPLAAAANVVNLRFAKRARAQTRNNAAATSPRRAILIEEARARLPAAPIAGVDRRSPPPLPPPPQKRQCLLSIGGCRYRCCCRSEADGCLRDRDRKWRGQH